MYCVEEQILQFVQAIDPLELEKVYVELQDKQLD
jgi:hypothetical protein